MTENDELIELSKTYQAKLAENNITVPGMVIKLFQNCWFKMPTDNLQGTGNKNRRGKDLNTNENMDNALNSNDHLNY